MADNTHECPADGCSRRCPPAMLGCRTHWFKVSTATRQALQRAWAHAPFTDRYFAARDAAVAEMNAAQ